MGHACGVAHGPRRRGERCRKGSTAAAGWSSAIASSWRSSTIPQPRQGGGGPFTSGRTAVLPDDRGEDQREGGEADEVEEAPLLVGNDRERQQPLAEAQQEEGQSKSEEEAVARPFPEAQEEEPGDEEQGGHRAGEEIDQHLHSSSRFQMKPNRRIESAAKASSSRST